MKGFALSCLHNASTGGSNANAGPEGGAKAFANARFLVAGTGFEPVTFRL